MELSDEFSSGNKTHTVFGFRKLLVATQFSACLSSLLLVQPSLLVRLMGKHMYIFLVLPPLGRLDSKVI